MELLTEECDKNWVKLAENEKLKNTWLLVPIVNIDRVEYQS